MDGSNFRIPKIITIQPDSLSDVPGEKDVGTALDELINATRELSYNNESEYSPIIVPREEVVTNSIASNVSPVTFGVNETQSSIAQTSSSFIPLHRNTGYVQLHSNKTVSTHPATVTSARAIISSRPNILSKSARPVGKKIAPKIVVIPPSNKGSVSTTVQRPNQNNPIVLSIGNLGTVTEQRYFTVPASESQSSALPVSQTSKSKAKGYGTQIARVPRNQIEAANKKKPASSGKSNGSTSSKSGNGGKSCNVGEATTLSQDKILGVKQNDIFFCNYCNYYTVFRAVDIFKHYVKHHKKSCTGVNCTKQFNTEIEMQLHIYRDHPELRGKLAPKEVFIETASLETFKKPVYVFSRTSLTKIIDGNSKELKEGEEDFLFTEKLFAPPRSYAKFMQQRYPDHTFKFKNLDDVSEESPNSVSHWSCPHCNVSSENYSEVFDHIRDAHTHQSFQPPLRLYTLDSTQGDNACDPSVPVIGEVRTDTESPASSWNSEVAVTVNGLEIQATVDSNSHVKVPLGFKKEFGASPNQQNQSKDDTVTSGTSDGMNSYLLTQKKASCGHYMPSFDTHRECKQCRQMQGLRCKGGGPKCADCENWSEELWGFVTSMYPQSDDDGAEKNDETTETARKKKSSKVKKCVCCSFYMPSKDRHATCNRCRKEKSTPTSTKPNGKQNTSTAEKGSSKNKDKTQESPKTPVKNCFVHLQSSPNRDKKMCKSCRQPMFMFDLHNDCESCRSEKGIYCSASGMRCNICKLLGDSYWKTLEDLSKAQKQRSDSSETRQTFDSFHGEGGMSDEDNDFMNEPEQMDDVHTTQNIGNNPTNSSSSRSQHDAFKDVEEVVLDHVPDDLKIDESSMYTYNPHDKTYSCTKCNTVRSGSSGRRNIRMHIKTHAVGKYWGCPYCNFQGSKKMVICKHIMKDHLNRRLKVIRRMPHSQNPGSQWEIAGEYTFNHSKRMARCNDCGKEFVGGNYASNAKTHIKFKHRGEKFGCEMCNFISVYKKKVMEHVAKKHPGESCQVISRNHPSDKKIKQEKKDVSVDSEVSTNNAVSSSVENSNQGSSKKPVYGCGYCTFSTLYYKNVRRHSRNIHRAKPVKIVQRKSGEVTGRAGPPRRKLDISHMTNEKTYSYSSTTGWYTCLLCHYKTKSSFAAKMMSVHFRMHHSGDADTFSHKCPHCSYTSLHRRYVTRHIRRKHSGKSAAKQTEKETPTPTWDEDYDNDDAGLPSPVESDNNDENGNVNVDGDDPTEAATVAPPPSMPVIIENIHNKYSYLPDSKVASCKICTHTTCGKHALANMRVHVTSHLESNLVPAPQIEDQQQNEGSLETTSEEHPSAGHTNEEEPFEEEIAGEYTFNDSKRLARCNDCGKEFVGGNYASNAKIHIKFKHRGEKFGCEMCKFISVYKNTVMEHIVKKHPGESCQVVVHPSDIKIKQEKKDVSADSEESTNKTVSSSVDNISKGSKTSKKSLYGCSYCSFTSAHSSNVGRHSRTRHKNKSVKIVPREPGKVTDKTEASKKTSSLSHVTREKTYSYDSTTGWYTCVLCHYKTNSSFAAKLMSVHFRIHHSGSGTSKKPVYGCGYCSFTSTHYSSVKKHSRTHHRTKPIKIVQRRSGEVTGSTETTNMKAELLKNEKTYSDDSTSESNLVPAPQVEDQQQNEESLETTSEEHPSAGHTNEDTLEEAGDFKPEGTSEISSNYTHNRKTKTCVCKLCGFVTKTTLRVKTMIMHLTNHEENMKRPVYTCPYCKMNSHSKKNIARHQKSIHPNKSIKIIKKKSSQEAVNNAEVETESINPADDLSESVIGAVSVVTPEKNSRQQNYNYLPDIRMASCKLCSYQTQGKNACLEMLNHVKVHESSAETVVQRTPPPVVPPAPSIVYGCSYCDFSSAFSTRDVSDHIKRSHPDLIIKVKVKSGEQHQKENSQSQSQSPQPKPQPQKTKSGKSDSVSHQRSPQKVESFTKIKKKFKKTKTNSQYKRISKVIKQAKYFLQCPYCVRCCIFPSIMENHIRCVHPDCNQDILSDSLNRPTQLSWTELEKQALSSSCFIKVTKLEHMKKFPALQEVLDTCGSVFRKKLDKKDKKWFGLMEVDMSEVSEESESDEVTEDNFDTADTAGDEIWRNNSIYPQFAQLPNPDDVFDLKGKPRTLHNLQFNENNPQIFTDRFRCFCKSTFSDLTIAKIHAVRKHSSVWKSFGNHKFKEITDMYAKSKYAPNKIYLCPKPECLFFSKLPSICELHQKCSGNPFRFWGASNLIQVMYRKLVSSEPRRRSSSHSSSMSLTISEVTGGLTDIADLSGPWDYEAFEVTDAMWRVSKSNSNFVVVPNIDDIFHIRGNAKILDVARFSKPGELFRDRFACRKCSAVFSDLTEAKIHVTKDHPSSYEWIGKTTFISVKDQATKDFKCKTTVYMCTNPGCVFLQKDPSKCGDHLKCSGNPLQFWGKKSDLKLDDSWQILDKPPEDTPSSDSEMENFVNLPVPEEVMQLNGELKLTQKFNLRKIDFPNRFLCHVCDKTSDELTEMKKHCLVEHAQRLKKTGNSGLYIAVIDIYAKLKNYISVIIVCSKPDCAFYTKRDSLIESHVTCSSNWWECSENPAGGVKDADAVPTESGLDEDTLVDDDFADNVLPSDSDVDAEVDKEEHKEQDDNSKDSRSECDGGTVSPTLSLIEEDLCMLTEGTLDMLADVDGADDVSKEAHEGNPDITRQSSQGESISDTEVPAEMETSHKIRENTLTNKPPLCDSEVVQQPAKDEVNSTTIKLSDKDSGKGDIMATKLDAGNRIQETITSTNKELPENDFQVYNLVEEPCILLSDESSVTDGIISSRRNVEDKIQGFSDDDVQILNSDQEDNRVEDLSILESDEESVTDVKNDGKLNKDCEVEESEEKSPEKEEKGYANLHNEISDSENCSAERRMDVEVMGDKELYEAVSDTEFSMDFEETDSGKLADVTREKGPDVNKADEEDSQSASSNKLHLSSHGQMADKAEVYFSDTSRNSEKYDKVNESQVDSTSNGERFESEATVPGDNDEGLTIEEQMKSTGILTTTCFSNNVQEQGGHSLATREEERHMEEMEEEVDEETGIERIVADIASCRNLLLQPNQDETMESSDPLESILDGSH